MVGMGRRQPVRRHRRVAEALPLPLLLGHSEAFVAPQPLDPGATHPASLPGPPPCAPADTPSGDTARRSPAARSAAPGQDPGRRECDVGWNDAARRSDTPAPAHSPGRSCSIQTARRRCDGLTSFPSRSPRRRRSRAPCPPRSSSGAGSPAPSTAWRRQLSSRRTGSATRGYVASDTSRCRATAARSAPSASSRSASRSFRMICSGVCRLLPIVMILLHPPSWATAPHHEWTDLKGSRHRRLATTIFPRRASTAARPACGNTPAPASANGDEPNIVAGGGGAVAPPWLAMTIL